MGTARIVVVFLAALSSLRCARVAHDDGGSIRAARCLPDEIAAPYLSSLAADMCVVAKYEMPSSPTRATTVFTWGSHDGPLAGPTPSSGSRPSIVRYSAPAAAIGTLDAREVTFDIGAIAEGATWLPRAVDLFGTESTVLSLSPPGHDVGDGEMFVVDREGIVSRRHIPGAAFPEPMVDDRNGVLVHSGYGALSLESTPADRTPAPGLYVSALCSPRRDLPPGDGCSTIEIMKVQREVCCNARATRVGPIAVDPAGNVFFPILYRDTFSLGTGHGQILAITRGHVASGAVPWPSGALDQVGVDDPPLTMQLVADGDRLCVDHSRDDGGTAAGPRVECVRYRADGDAITPVGKPFVLLLASASVDRRSALVVDRSGRLWVGFADRVEDFASKPAVRVFLVLAAR